MELTKLSKGLVSATDTFTFANVTVTGNITATNFNYTNGTPVSGGGSALNVKDEGNSLTAGATSINFVGSGVTATASGTDVTVTISGGGGGSGASSAVVAGYALVFGGF